MRVFYQNICGQSHDELVAGKARFERAEHQGNTPVTALLWSGLKGPSTIAIEALDSGCPFQGHLSPVAMPARTTGGPTGGPLQHQPFFTLDQAQAADPNNDVFVNGEHDGRPRPQAIACSQVDSNQSLQLVTLRQEEEELQAEGARRGIEETTLADRRPSAAAQHILRETGNEVEDLAVEEAKGELRYAMTKYTNNLERIDSAGLELASTRAAFKYRYSIIEPAQIPRAPTKPKAKLVLIGGLLGGVMLAMLVAVGIDLRSGKLHQPRQIGRQLALPILGEVWLE